MKKRFICLLLAICLILTACGKKQPEVPEIKDPVDSQQTQGTEEKEPLATDDTLQEEEPEQTPENEEIKQEEKREEEKEEEEKKEELPPPPKYDPLVKVTADQERVVNAADKGMSAGMEQALLDLVDCYYRSVGGLAVQDCSELFSTQDEADWHKAIWETSENSV